MTESNLRLEFLSHLTYMAVSARGCVDEPKLYGPFRLVDAMSRLIDIMLESRLADPKLSKGLAELKDTIDASKLSVMDREADYPGFLDEVVLRTIQLLDQAEG